MKQIGASHVVAMALTAFAAAGVSAQSGTVTAVPSTDAQACTVSGVAGASFHTSTDGNATYVTTADGQRVATVTRAVGGFGGGAAMSAGSGSGAGGAMGGGAAGAMNAVAANGVVSVAGGSGGAVAIRATTENGATFSRVTPADGTAEGVATYTVKRAPDGTMTVQSADGKVTTLDSKEAAKYHVKRPTSGTMTYVGSGSENAVAEIASTTAAHARLMAVDGSASPVACRIVVRQTDGGGN